MGTLILKEINGQLYLFYQPKGSRRITKIGLKKGVYNKRTIDTLKVTNITHHIDELPKKGRTIKNFNKLTPSVLKAIEITNEYYGVE